MFSNQLLQQNKNNTNQTRSNTSWEPDLFQLKPKVIFIVFKDTFLVKEKKRLGTKLFLELVILGFVNWFTGITTGGNG